MNDTLQTVAQYATARGITPRQVMRYLAADRLPGAVKLGGSWSIPADARPTPLGSDMVTTSQDVPVTFDAPFPWPARVVPPGLWELRDVARYLGTSVPGLRRLVGDGPIGIIGPYGDQGGDRLYVAP